VRQRLRSVKLAGLPSSTAQKVLPRHNGDRELSRSGSVYLKVWFNTPSNLRFALAPAQTTQRLQRIGIKPDGIIGPKVRNFLSNEPPFRSTQRLRYRGACSAENHWNAGVHTPANLLFELASVKGTITKKVVNRSSDRGMESRQYNKFPIQRRWAVQ
jgi:hypothetical protein